MTDAGTQSTAPRSGWGAVIAGGGSGLRLGGPVRKQFIEIAGKSILRHSLELFMGLPEVIQIAVVLPTDALEEFRDSLSAEERKRVIVVAGGPSRQLSVLSGLEALDPVRISRGAIHDAARPLADPAVIRRTFEQAGSGEGAMACAPVRDTVKRSDGRVVTGTLDREGIWLAQTPQTFPLEAILAAHRAALRAGFEGTDDAALFERLGLPVRVVRSDPGNLKITEPGDLEYAGFRLGNRGETMEMRIGQGYDIHPLVEGRPLVLGGVRIDCKLGLQGHSDADVLAHAITDALLGALALGDIGKHFPDTDPAFKGADSLVLMARALELVRARSFRPVNVDATVIAERPKLAPHFPKMAANIARVLGLDEGRVSLKATTNEHLGAIGRGEGIAALAVVLVSGSGAD